MSDSIDKILNLIDNRCDKNIDKNTFVIERAEPILKENKFK